MSIEISRRKFLVVATGAAVGVVAVEIARRNNLLVEKNTSPTPPTETQTFSPTSTPTPELTPTPTAVPTPEKPPLSKEMLYLQQTLKSEIDAYQGQTTIAITDVLAKETIDVYGNRPQLPGCVVNLACALTAVSELSKKTALFTKEEIEDDLTIMVRHSDPNVGLRVVKTIGAGSIEKGVDIINGDMKDWGMYKSWYDHPPAYDETYTAHGVPNQIAGAEMNSVLARVASGDLFNKNTFDWNIYALWVMSNNKVGLNFMIPGEIPESDATVFHKVGWVPGQPNTINDAGVVSAVDHRFLYTITFMYQNLDTAVAEQNLFYGPGFFGRKLSKMTYDTFCQKYPKQ